MKITGAYFKLYEVVHRQMTKKNVRKTARGRLRKPNLLTPEEKKQAKAFYAPYTKTSIIDHRYMKEKTGDFKPEYMTREVYLNDVDAYFNNQRIGRVIDNKAYYPRVFVGIPQGVNIVSRIGQFWMDGDWNIITREKADEIIAGEDRVFLKQATASSGGAGVFCIKKENGDMKQGLDEALKKVQGDLVIQKAIRQHTDMERLNPSSVNTLRVLSLLTQDGVKFYSSIVRIGRAGSETDNVSLGGFVCGIDENGRMKKRGFDPAGILFYEHPDTGIPFEGYQIPNYNKVLELIRKAHPMVPHFRLVSWDIAIDEAGEPLVVEANLYFGGLQIHQLCNGPLFGKDSKAILDEVYGKNK